MDPACIIWDQYQVIPSLVHPLHALFALLAFSNSTMEEKKEKVKWSQADDMTLLHMLATEKNEGHWGDNNPKPTVWVECAQALAGSEKQLGGITKQASTIKGRWQKVCFIISYNMRY
jgi:hypothetical protein